MNIKDFIPSFESFQKDELYKVLESNADKVRERDDWTRQLTEGEISKRQQEIGQNETNISTIQDKKDEMSKQYNEEMKPFKDANKGLIEEVKTGFAKESGTAFQFNDEETRTATFFTATGEFIRSRSLRPDERQRTILSVVRENEQTGTNG